MVRNFFLILFALFLAFGSVCLFLAGAMGGDMLPAGPWPIYVLGVFFAAGAIGVVVFMFSEVKEGEWQVVAANASGSAAEKEALVIKSPRIGFLNLLGADGDAIMQSDRQVLANLFSSDVASDENVPNCDVLFVYASLDEEGAVPGTNQTLEGIVQRAGARIVVLASEDEDPKMKSTTAGPTLSRTDMVFTLDRSNAFAEFFKKIFEKMMQGTPMPLAWVELAPQNPNAAHGEVGPDAIYLPMAGFIVFAR